MNLTFMAIALQKFRPNNSQFRGPSSSADFCYHKFKTVSKSSVCAGTEIRLFKTFLIITITPRSP